MVTFGIENSSFIFKTHLEPRLSYPFLIITTNEITNEILKQVDTVNVRNVAFQVPLDINSRKDKTFDFNVDLWEWERFSKNMITLELRGTLVKKQFSAMHLECMNCLNYLYIGSTNYELFDGDCVSNLPMIKYIMLNGFGIVQRSKIMDKWLEKLELNECITEFC